MNTSDGRRARRLGIFSTVTSAQKRVAFVQKSRTYVVLITHCKPILYQRSLFIFYQGWKLKRTSRSIKVKHFTVVRKPINDFTLALVVIDMCARSDWKLPFSVTPAVVWGFCHRTLFLSLFFLSLVRYFTCSGTGRFMTNTSASCLCSLHLLFQSDIALVHDVT